MPQRAPQENALGSAYCAVQPPSTSNVVPVTKLEAREARNTAGPTISHLTEAPLRHPADDLLVPSLILHDLPDERRGEIGGARAFTRMLCGANSRASTRVSWTTAPLLAAYAAWRSMATRPNTDAMFMIFPWAFAPSARRMPWSNETGP